VISPITLSVVASAIENVTVIPNGLRKFVESDFESSLPLRDRVFALSRSIGLWGEREELERFEKNSLTSIPSPEHYVL
jgi:hypothetical protein